MSETPTLARFIMGWAEDGQSKDGLPHYREVVKIQLSRPPYLEVTRDATDADIDAYNEPYRLFEKEEKARKHKPVQGGGFPLVLWPAVSTAELKMLAVRDIHTIEQLARLTAHDAPGELRELADRAKRMIEMSKDVGKFEGLLRDKDGQIEVLQEQIRDLRGTVQAQDGIINSLKARVA